jgi:hypothetical protein
VATTAPFFQVRIKIIKKRKKGQLTQVLSSTRLKGEFILRACILSFRTHQAEVEEAFEIITSEAQKLAKE